MPKKKAEWGGAQEPSFRCRRQEKLFEFVLYAPLDHGHGDFIGPGVQEDVAIGTNTLGGFNFSAESIVHF